MSTVAAARCEAWGERPRVRRSLRRTAQPRRPSATPPPPVEPPGFSRRAIATPAVPRCPPVPPVEASLRPPSPTHARASRSTTPNYVSVLERPPRQSDTTLVPVEPQVGETAPRSTREGSASRRWRWPSLSRASSRGRARSSSSSSPAPESRGLGIGPRLRNSVAAVAGWMRAARPLSRARSRPPVTAPTEEALPHLQEALRREALPPARELLGSSSRLPPSSSTAGPTLLGSSGRLPPGSTQALKPPVPRKATEWPEVLRRIAEAYPPTSSLPGCNDAEFSSEDCEDTCAICCEDFSQVEMGNGKTQQLGCGHVFHNECLGEWFRKEWCTHGTATCPMCRRAAYKGGEGICRHSEAASWLV